MRFEHEAELTLPPEPLNVTTKLRPKRGVLDSLQESIKLVGHSDYSLLVP